MGHPRWPGPGRPAGWRRCCGPARGTATATAQRRTGARPSPFPRPGPGPAAGRCRARSAPRRPSPSSAAAEASAVAPCAVRKPPGSRTRANAPSAAAVSRSTPGHASARGRATGWPVLMAVERMRRWTRAAEPGSRCESGAVPPLSATPASRAPPRRESGTARRRRPITRAVPNHPGRGPRAGASLIVLLSTSDTDLLSARASGAAYRLGNPSRVELDELPALLGGATAVVVRILGGYRAWEAGIDAVLASGVPAVVLGGEATPDADLMRLSTVAGGIVAEAHAYLANGGPANLLQLSRFLSDAIALTGEGFEPPAQTPTWGQLERASSAADEGPTVAILYYRAHHLAGNTGFVHALSDAVESAGGPRPTGVLLEPAHGRARPASTSCATADAIVVTVLAAGGSLPAAVGAGGNDEEWDIGALAAARRPDPAGAVPDQFSRPVGRQRRRPDPAGRRDPDRDPRVRRTADHRPVLVQGSRAPTGSPRYVPDPERTARVAGIAVKPRAAAPRTHPRERRIALVLSAYPTKHARDRQRRRPGHPGLAPSGCCDAMRERRLRRRRRLRRAARRRADQDGDAPDPRAHRRGRPGRGVAHQTASWPGDPVRISAAATTAPWFGDPRRRSCATPWQQALGSGRPASCSSTAAMIADGEIVLAALRAGNVVLMVQPPRGFGENPGRDLPRPRPAAEPPLPGRLPLAASTASAPTRSCTSASTATWNGCRARTSALSAACAPDAALGDLPLIYPFLVNDPGEGTQAKRRAHATIDRPPGPADGPRRDLRRHRPARAAARRARRRSRRSTRPSCRRSGPRSGR